MTSNIKPHPSSARPAVIYCRLAAVSQRRDASVFQNQEDSCRAYAAAKGYDVQAVFHEHASGLSGLAERPRLQALMSYLEAHKNKAMVVITVDPDRLSRDLASQVPLRTSIRKLGATIEHLDGSSSAAYIDNFINLMNEMSAETKRTARQRRRKAAKE